MLHSFQESRTIVSCLLYNSTDLSHDGAVPGESGQDGAVDEVTLEVMLWIDWTKHLTYPEQTEDHRAGKQEVEYCDLQPPNIEWETVTVGNCWPKDEV